MQQSGGGQSFGGVQQDLPGFRIQSVDDCGQLRGGGAFLRRGKRFREPHGGGRTFQNAQRSGIVPHDALAAIESAAVDDGAGGHVRGRPFGDSTLADLLRRDDWLIGGGAGVAEFAAGDALQVVRGFTWRNDDGCGQIPAEPNGDWLRVFPSGFVGRPLQAIRGRIDLAEQVQ